MPRSVIETEGLTKCFRIADKQPGLLGAVRHVVRGHYVERLAVDNLTLTIGEGETVGYVGPNGAGKSTTVKMLTGITVPTSGVVRVNGLVPHEQRIRNARNIGVVFGQRSQLWWDLPVHDSFRLLGDIYRLSSEQFRSSMAELTDVLELGPLLRMPTRQLSLGQKMRCELAAALLHRPSILYLDEPTIGLDIAVKDRIREFIRERNQEQGVTVVLTSHDLGDIEKTCRRLIMIDRGTVVFDGRLDEMKARFGRNRSIQIDLAEAAPEASRILADELAGVVGLALIQPDPYHLTVEFDAASITVGRITSKLVSQLPIQDLRIEEPTIESIIRQLYDGTLELDDADG